MNCESCYYYGKAADAPETAEEECMWVPSEESGYHRPCEEEKGMELMINTLDEARNEISSSLKRIETGYINIAKEAVRLGFVLRQVESSGILYASGYGTVAELAAAEFGLNATAVSRFIQMNLKYSVNGNSEEMDERYINFDKSKLQEMLGLPSYIIECLDPGMTRTQIREVVKEVQEEEKISEIEKELEEAEERVITMDSNIKRFLFAYYKDKPEEYVWLHKNSEKEEAIYRCLAPSGVASLVARVEGYGRMMLTISEMDKPLKLVNVRSGEFEEINWQQFKEAIKEILIVNEIPEESWQQVYGEDFPKKEIKEESIKQSKLPDSKPKEDVKKEEKKEKPKAEEKKADKQSKVPVLEEKKKEEIAPAQVEEIVLEESPYIKEKREAVRKEFNSLGEYIRQKRWKQAQWSLKELTGLVEDIIKSEKTEEQIPGQMEMEEMAADEEREDSED